MENVYCYETIEDLEKAVIDKAMNLDMMHSTNIILLECNIRTTKNIIIWASLILSVIIACFIKVKLGIYAFIILMAIIYCGYCNIISWVKFKRNKSFINLKLNLIEKMMGYCKEFNEIKCEDWQKDQIIKRLISLSNMCNNDQQ